MTDISDEIIARLTAELANLKQDFEAYRFNVTQQKEIMAAEIKALRLTIIQQNQQRELDKDFFELHNKELKRVLGLLSPSEVEK